MQIKILDGTINDLKEVVVIINGVEVFMKETSTTNSKREAKLKRAFFAGGYKVKKLTKLEAEKITLVSQVMK